MKKVEKLKKSEKHRISDFSDKMTLNNFIYPS